MSREDYCLRRQVIPPRSTTREIKVDTQEIRNDTATIKQDTAQILAEIARLRALLPAEASREEGRNLILDRYFDQLTNYAETVCGDSGDRDSEMALDYERYAMLKFA